MQGYNELRQSLEKERKNMAAALAPPEPKGSNDTNENNEMANLIVKGPHDNAESELILQGRYKEWDSTKVFSVQGEHKKKHLCASYVLI